MCFGNKSKQVNVRSFALFWRYSISESLRQMGSEVLFFLLMSRSETDDTKGSRLSFMFLQQTDGLMFRLLHLFQTPKTGGPGGASLSSDCVSRPGFNPISMVTVPIKRGTGWGSLCPRQMFGRDRLCLVLRKLHQLKLPTFMDFWYKNSRLNTSSTSKALLASFILYGHKLFLATKNCSQINPDDIYSP